MSGSPGKAREKRLAELIRADLSNLLVRGELRDPALSGLIVNAVDVTRDLGVAKVWVRSLDEVDAATRKKMLAAVVRASGAMRRSLADSLDVRRIPELRFEWDEAGNRASRLESLLEEIAHEKKEKSE